MGVGSIALCPVATVAQAQEEALPAEAPPDSPLLAASFAPPAIPGPALAPPAPEAPRGLPAWAVALPVAAHLADAVTTDLALRRGASESNPLMRGAVQNRAVLYGTKLAVGAGQAWFANWLTRRGHRTAGRIVLAFSVVPLYAAGSNAAGLR